MGVTAWMRQVLGLSSRASIEHFDPMWQSAQMIGQGMFGMGLPLQTLGGQAVERMSADFAGMASGGHRANGVIFACMLNRQLVFSTVGFQYQYVPTSETFGDQSLELLERPWPGGTTQDLLTRVINDADLAGNSFHTVETNLANLGGDGGKELVRLRPDWVTIAIGRRESGLGYRKLGYVYTEGGPQSGEDDVPLLVEDVAHFAPIPDPLASFRGMSWLTPIIREIQSDQAMTTHQQAYFENGATPNMIVKHPQGASPESVKRFSDMLEATHQGAGNAYKRLHLYPGADATVVGSNLEQLEFAVTRGHGETRVAAAAGVPPIIVGLSEGLASATYSNYGQARRRFADGTMHPLWQNVAGSFAPLLPDAAPLKRAGVRLWYDATNVPFLREDEKDAAEIQSVQAQTMAALVREGFEWESVKKAVIAGDWRNLQHSGLTSVQLQKPGGEQPSTPDQPSGPSLTVAGGRA